MTSSEFVDCKNLGPGTLVDVETKNRHYQIECLGGNAIRISGHPEYCPTPVDGELQDVWDKEGVLEAGFIGQGRHLKFRVFDDHRPVTTTRVTRIRVQRPSIH